MISIFTQKNAKRGRAEGWCHVSYIYVWLEINIMHLYHIQFFMDTECMHMDTSLNLPKKSVSRLTDRLVIALRA